MSSIRDKKNTELQKAYERATLLSGEGLSRREILNSLHIEAESFSFALSQTFGQIEVDQFQSLVYSHLLEAYVKQLEGRAAEKRK